MARRKRTEEPKEQPQTRSGMTLETVQKMLKDSVGHRNKWRDEAKKAYDFVAGEQWSPEERQVMEDLMRPVTVFNRISPIVDAIVGHETANRQAVAYLPRQVGATSVAEVLSAAAKWVRDECGADGEESDAFQDCVVTGEGWTDTRIDYADDPDGKIIIERVDPREMDADQASQKKNYCDAKWLCRTRKMDRSRAREIWPQGNFEPANRRTGQGPIDVITAAFYHLDSGKEGRSGVEADLVLIHDFQWWDMERVYRVPAQNLPPMVVAALANAEQPVRPSETGLLTFNEEQWKVVTQGLASAGITPPEPVVQRQKRYKRMFWSGEKILEEKDTPTGDSFTYKAITAKRDHSKRCWYGIVRGMRDPQLWSNKFMSLALENMGASAKGGVMVEIDAVEDPRKLEEDWADPTRIVYMKPGAIANKKVMPRPMTPLPPAAQELMMYCNQSLNDAAGVNPAVMGFSKELDVSGVLEQTRLQAGLNLLSYLFDSLRRYRKEQGVLLMAMIREYVPQGRLVKVEGNQGAQYVKLAFDPNVMKYDIVVDEAPTSPNVKQQTWESFLPLAKVFGPAIANPAFLLPLLKYSPFPSALVQEWTKAATNPQVQQQHQQQQQLQAADVMAQVHERTASANLKNAQAAHVGQESPMEVEGKIIEQQTARIEAGAKMQEAQARTAQTHLEMHEAQLHHHLDTQAAVRDAQLAEHQAHLQMQQAAQPKSTK